MNLFLILSFPITTTGIHQLKWPQGVVHNNAIKDQVVKPISNQKGKGNLNLIPHFHFFSTFKIASSIPDYPASPPRFPIGRKQN